jgi:REP element-mobilizing transposase RayT
MTWATLRREPGFSKQAAVKVSEFLTDYAPGKGIYMAINYVNPEHVHTLIDLPTGLTIEDAFQAAKGSLLPLDQSEPHRRNKVPVGQRLWSVLSVALKG